MTKTVSAGGVIYRFRLHTPQVLLICDTNYSDWFLPKGHVELGEDLEAAAKREVNEEVGLAAEDLEVKTYLGSFARELAETQEEKTEHYFLLELASKRPYKIAIEKGKSWQTGWFGQASLPKFYIPDQKKIVVKAFEEIKRLANH